MPSISNSCGRVAMRIGAVVAAMAVAFACASGGATPSGPPDSRGSLTGSNATLDDAGSGDFGSPDGAPGACTGDGWNFKIVQCDGGRKTTVTAKIYDPARKVPPAT